MQFVADSANLESQEWATPAHEDAYHGKVRSRDNQVFWIIPRLHFRSGWAVEVRAESADGPVVERSWQPHQASARALADNRRRQIARAGTADQVLKPAVFPPPLRGIIAVHGYRGGKGTVIRADVDDGPPALPCSCVRGIDRSSMVTTRHLDIIT